LPAQITATHQVHLASRIDPPLCGYAAGLGLFLRKPILRRFGSPEGFGSVRAFQRRWQPFVPPKLTAIGEIGSRRYKL